VTTNLFILQPFTFIIDIFFTFFVYAMGSVGLAVVAVALTVSLCLQPVKNKITKLEDKVLRKKNYVHKQVQNIDKNVSGEVRFREIERIYRDNSFNPIQNIFLGSSFYVTLPFLIAAFFYFSESQVLQAQNFLIIADLSEPDRLAFGINILPVLMTALTILDAYYRFNGDKVMFLAFFTLSVIIFILVYNLPASLILFWMASNMVAFGGYLFKQTHKY
jgi:membrane protein insertase Oxa1/YidC/SpoIIIJ